MSSLVSLSVCQSLCVSSYSICVFVTYRNDQCPLLCINIIISIVIIISQRTDGATSEKLDFKLSLPCCAFVIPVPCDGKQFSDLLSGGLLCEAQTVKVLSKHDVPLSRTSGCSSRVVRGV